MMFKAAFMASIWLVLAATYYGMLAFIVWDARWYMQVPDLPYCMRAVLFAISMPFWFIFFSLLGVINQPDDFPR